MCACAHCTKHLLHIFCVHNILLLLSFSTQSYSLAGIVALPTLYLHAPWVVAVMCIHCAEALATCWISTTEASAGYCFDCHIVYFSLEVMWLWGNIAIYYIPGYRDVSWYFPRSHMTFKMLNTTSAVPLKLWLPMAQVWMNVWGCSIKTHAVHMRRPLLYIVYLQNTGTFFTYYTLFDLSIET